MNTKLITLLRRPALPKLELHRRYSYWNSRFIGHGGIDGVGVVPNRHRILQQQQQQQHQLRVFSTSLFSSYSSSGNHQDATPLSALNNETIGTSASSFDNIRTNNGLYVDKTQHIYDNILKLRIEKYFFLVRPRRFGKSLLCSTLANLFLGKAKEELFKGLWIHDSKVWDFEKEEHPVLHLDMSNAAGPEFNVDSFEIAVKEMLNDALDNHDISLPPTNFPIKTAFSYVINNLKRKYKKPVVVIIDEYDKPVLDLIDSPEQMEAVRESLQSFYAILKPQESNLRLVFITGLYKFTEMSMFSTLNNLLDISLHVDAGSLVGYTEGELRAYFGNHISALKTKSKYQDDEDVMNELREKYNGYRFGVNTANGKVSELIYNPFAINHVLNYLRFSDQWSLSGSASLLADKLVAAGYKYDSL